MELLIALALFGALCAIFISNRNAAAACALLGALVVWYLGPRFGSFFGQTPSGLQVAQILNEAGVGEVSIWMLCAAAFAGLLVAWALFGRGPEHRPDWDWDPDHPNYRKRLRRKLGG